jgi:hypothetical protein
MPIANSFSNRWVQVAQEREPYHAGPIFSSHRSRSTSLASGVPMLAVSAMSALSPNRPDPDFIKVGEQIRWILINAIRAGLDQFFLAVTTGQNADTES